MSKVLASFSKRRDMRKNLFQESRRPYDLFFLQNGEQPPETNQTWVPQAVSLYESCLLLMCLLSSCLRSMEGKKHMSLHYQIKILSGLGLAQIDIA